MPQSPRPSQELRLLADPSPTFGLRPADQRGSRAADSSANRRRWVSPGCSRNLVPSSSSCCCCLLRPHAKLIARTAQR